MTGKMIGCACYVLLGLIFMGFGMRLLVSKRENPVGFWANVKELPKVKDVKAYNRAVGKLWCGYGVIIVLLGLPMLGGPGGIMLTILGTAWASIGLAAVYSAVIIKKYEIK